MITISKTDRRGKVIDTFTFTVEQHFWYLWKRECNDYRADTCNNWRGVIAEGIGLQKRLFSTTFAVLTNPEHGLDVDMSAFEKLL